MSDLPEPRADGICLQCLAKPAVTNDGRFCKKCLKEIVRTEMTANPRDLSRRGTDATGRSARATQVTGGAADIPTEETDW